MQIIKRQKKNWLRLLGLGVLVLLLWHIDVSKILGVLLQVVPSLLVIAILLNVPQIGVKTLRWRCLLQCQGIAYPFLTAFLANFGSIFIGLMTPGRIGEFVKAMHVSQDCDVSSARAFSTVLADRLFDLYLLLFVGGMALLSVSVGSVDILKVIGAIFVITLPLVVFLYDSSFNYLQVVGVRLGRVGRKLFTPGSWLVEMRRSLLQLTWPYVVMAAALTILAYSIFFGQCYLLALGLGLKIGFVQVCLAVALGSLVTLLPVSISGLGTREATIVVYMGTAGIPAEVALSFSLLIFITFYVAGGLMGAAAWSLKPVPLGGTN